MARVFDGNWEGDIKDAIHRLQVENEMEIARRASIEDDAKREMEKNDTMTPEDEYISHCFLDLSDSGDIDKIVFSTNRVTIDIKRSKTVNKTFNNYLSTTRKTAKVLEMIDESITKVRINNPHVNSNFEIYDSTLRIILDI